MQEPELCCQPGFVAVHVGAGYHSHKHENTYLKGKRLPDVSKRAHNWPDLTDLWSRSPSICLPSRSSSVKLHVWCATSCSGARGRCFSWLCLNSIHRRCNQWYCVTLLPCLVQENEHTNAGIGSNLTLNGTVEADASIMLGERTFAAVGATPGTQSTADTQLADFFLISYGHMSYVICQLRILAAVGPAEILLDYKHSKTSPQCRNAFLLSPDVSLVKFQCRDDVSELT